MMPKKFKLMIASVLAIIMLDQLTKYLVDTFIYYDYDARPPRGDSYTIIRNFFELTHHRNTGAAWGSLDGQLTLFIIITVVALGVFIYLAKDINYKTMFFYSLGITLLIGGTIGNFIDRLFRHDNAVVDMLDFYIFGYNFPVFNVADMALTIGMFAFALDIFFLEPKRQVKNEGVTDEETV